MFLWKKNEQPQQSRLRKDDFRLREGSREMGCDCERWEGAGMESQFWVAAPFGGQAHGGSV